MEPVLHFLTNPFVAAGLIVLAGLGLLAEIKHGAFGLGLLASFVCMGLFFGASVSLGLAGWHEILLFGLGLLAIAAEVFVLPGFGVAGVIGIALLGTSLLLTMLGPAPTTGDVARAALALGTALVLVVAVAAAWLRHLPHSRRFAGLLHRGGMESAAGYVSAAARPELVGCEGVAVTPLRPAGAVEIAGERLDVVAEGGYIPEGARVVVTRSDGYRHVVRPLA